MNKQTPSVPALMDELYFQEAAFECELALRAMFGHHMSLCRPLLLEHLRRAFVQGMQRQGRVSQTSVDHEGQS